MSPTKRASSEMDASDEIPVQGEVQAKKPRKSGFPIKWTPNEDAIYAEIAEKVLKAGMWDAVKADKRIEHRKANGIATHLTVMIKRMAKQG